MRIYIVVSLGHKNVCECVIVCMCVVLVGLSDAQFVLYMQIFFCAMLFGDDVHVHGSKILSY